MVSLVIEAFPDYMDAWNQFEASFGGLFPWTRPCRSVRYRQFPSPKIVASLYVRWYRSVKSPVFLDVVLVDPWYHPKVSQTSEHRSPAHLEDNPPVTSSPCKWKGCLTWFSCWATWGESVWDSPWIHHFDGCSTSSPYPRGVLLGCQYECRWDFPVFFFGILCENYVTLGDSYRIFMYFQWL